MNSIFEKYNKEEVFYIFGRNLELVKRNPRITIKGVKTEGYVCPVCQKIFGKEALFSTEYVDYLTLEHVPPESLGGSIKLLTCKICNNEQGSKLDKQLLESLKTKDFYSGISGAERPARFLVDGKWNTGGRIINSDSRDFEFRSIRNNSNHNHYDKLFKDGGLDIEKIDVTINHKFKKRRPPIALLRIGFLWLYSELGVASLISGNMQAVRKQIHEPEKEWIKNIGSLDNDFSDNFIGVNIVKEPKELRSFAVAFKTRTKHKERKHIVLLPGLSDPGLKIYENMRRLSDEDKKVTIQLIKLNLDGILSDPNRVFEYHEAWNWLVNQ
jgi:hypothetical protein